MGKKEKATSPKNTKLVDKKPKATANKTVASPKTTAKTSIGLDSNKTKVLADKLNSLLADYQVFYMNARGFHYNIRGQKFFELHLKFEELYSDLILKADEVAERVLTLGYTPDHAYSVYLKNSALKEITGVSDGQKAVGHVLDAFSKLLVKERELLDLSADANDEGTNSMMSDYIREQEKLVWMYSAYVG